MGQVKALAVGSVKLTNDEIHAIRIEHSERTKNLPFEEYKRQLDSEIAPTLHRLEKLKKSYAKKTNETVK